MRRRFLRFALAAVIALGLLVIAAPVLVATAARTWLWWQARRQNLICTVDRIKAPLLRPLELRGIHITGKSGSRLDVKANRVTVGLNLRAILLRTQERAVRSLSIQGIDGEFHRIGSSPFISTRAWGTVQQLLPDGFSIDRLNLRIEDGPAVILLREASINGSEIETGAFTASEVVVNTPLFRQTFTGLRAAANWQGDRLTIAGLSLALGLDVQSITADLAQLNEEQVGFNFDIDAFGGKIRVDVSSEWHSHPSTWNVAGSATDISLEQTSKSFGFTDQVNGMLHACKFTFRGDPRDPASATASIWMELTRMAWRNRAADVIMLGAALYNRQVQLQQLYVKQDRNQLTLNGEAGFQAKTFDWLNPDFRGTISASVNNLGQFASLFGANPGDFAGEMRIEGTMSAGNRKIGGHLSATGSSLSILQVPIETFTAQLNLTATALEFEHVELHQQNDFLHGQGRMDWADGHAYSGTADFAIDSISEYLKLLPPAWGNVVTGGGLNAEWSGKGKADSHSGTLRLHGRSLVVRQPGDLLPFNAEVQADYSPGSIFFPRVHLVNAQASLNGFLTLADKFLQAQAVAFDVNGKPKLRGNVFVPLSLSKLRAGSRIKDAIDPGQKVDVDVNIEPTDLAELSNALFGRRSFTGIVSARVSIFGGVDALQGWANLHGQDLAAQNDAARLSTEADVRFAAGTLNTKVSLGLAGCSPVEVQASFPIRLTSWDEAVASEPLSATVNIPAVFANRLPRYVSHDALRDGIISGKMDVAGSLRHPSISGDLQLSNGKLGLTTLNLTDASTRLTFKGDTAIVDFLNLASPEIDLSLRGSVDFADLTAMELRLTASAAVVDLAPRRTAECVSRIRVTAISADEPIVANIDSIALRGSLFSKSWTVSLTDHRPDDVSGSVDAAGAIRSFPFCRDEKENGAALTFGCERRSPPEPVPAPKKRRISRHRKSG